jgi:hypothetical protein
MSKRRLPTSAAVSPIPPSARQGRSTVRLGRAGAFSESAQGLPASPPKDAESSHLARVGKDIDELAERVAHIEPSDAPWFVGRAVFDAKSRRPHGVQGRIQIVDLD